MDSGSEPAVMEITEATPEERQAIGLVEPEGLTCRAWIAREDGEMVGHIAISINLGILFGHDTAYWGKDKTGAARLWIHARDAAHEMGFYKGTVHLMDGDPMKEFWIRRGFKKLCEVYEGEF
jgi:hypothetical protein